MQKVFLLSSLLLSSLLADNSLGEKISLSSADETIVKNHSPLPIEAHQHNQTTHLDTRLSPHNVKNAFKSDHHRYDKRYADFDYDRYGYYNNDGYYFGYYDNNGYFFNNIFFAYNRHYTYHDRRYRRGFFRPRHRHHRRYVHHTFNDWNRIHCYREPNIIVRGHYYNRAYYPPSNYRSNHHTNHNVRLSYHNSHRYKNNAHHTPSRMNVTRMNGKNRINREENNRPHASHQNSYREKNSHRDKNSHRMQRNNERRSDTRMRTRNSSPRSSSHGNQNSRHMRMSK